MIIKKGSLIAIGLSASILAKIFVSIPAIALLSGIQNPAIAASSEESVEEETSSPPVIDYQSLALAQCETPESLLLSIQGERALVASQRDQLSARMAEIALAEEKLLVEKASLNELKITVEGLLRRVDDSQTEDLARLVALYKNMKPNDAARIMDDLDIEVTIMVLASMKPRAAAPVLAKMSEVRARAVSKIILERSKLPGDQNLTGIRLK